MRWRRDFSDMLYVRRREAGEAGYDGDDGSERADRERRFEVAIAKVPEVFNGDGCVAPLRSPWRAPLRKVALLEIQCGARAASHASCACRLVAPFVAIWHTPGLPRPCMLLGRAACEWCDGVIVCFVYVRVCACVQNRASHSTSRTTRPASGTYATCGAPTTAHSSSSWRCHAPHAS